MISDTVSTAGPWHPPASGPSSPAGFRRKTRYLINLHQNIRHEGKLGTTIFTVPVKQLLYIIILYSMLPVFHGCLCNCQHGCQRRHTHGKDIQQVPFKFSSNWQITDVVSFSLYSLPPTSQYANGLRFFLSSMLTTLFSSCSFQSHRQIPVPLTMPPFLFCCWVCNFNIALQCQC